MGIVIDFRRDDISAEDVLRYFFHEINQAHDLNLSLTDEKLQPHIPALKCLADVYIKTSANEIKGLPEELQAPLITEIKKLRARFLAETVLGILQKEGIVQIVPDKIE